MSDPAPGPRLRILYLEDAPEDLELVQRELGRSGMLFELRHVHSREPFRRELERFEPHVVLADYQVPGFDGMSALQLVLEHAPETPFIFVSGTLGDDRAAETLKMGAADYVLKDALGRLVPAIHGAVATSRERRERRGAEEMYRALFDGVPVGLFRSTPEGRLLEVNQTVVEIFGFDTAEELVNRDALSLYVHKRDRDRWRARLEADGVIRDHEYQARRKDGTEIWVRSSARAVVTGGRTVYCEGSIQDVTAWRRAEDDRAQGMLLLGIGEELAHVGSWTTDHVAGTTAWSAGLYRILGLAPSSVRPSQETFIAHVHPEDRESVARTIDTGLRDERAFSYETRIIRPDGTTRWVRAENTIALTADGEVARSFGMAMDITERREDREALAKSEERYRLIGELVSDFAYVINVEEDTSLTLVWVTDAFERKLGYSLEEANRMGLFNLIHPEDRETAMAAFGRVLSGADAHAEYRMVDSAGRPRWVRSGVRAEKDPRTGRVVRLVGASEDITDRKEAELRLRTSELRLREAQAVAHVGSWEWDMVDGQVSWSDEVHRIFGTDPESFIPSLESYLDCVHAEDRAPTRRMIDDWAEAGIIESYEVRICRPDGSVRHIQVEGRVVRDAKGRPIRMIGTTADVTERVNGEQAIREQARQQAVVAELGTLALGDIDLDDLLLEASRRLSETLGTDLVSIYELLPGEDELFLRGGTGWDDDYIGAVTVPRSEATQTWVAIQTGAPVVSPDIERDPRFVPAWFRTRNGVRSGATVLMEAEGETYGALAVDSRTLRDFTEHEVHFIQSVANTLAGSIRRAQAGHALRVSEERYRSLFEEVPVALYRSLPDGGIQEANRALVDLLGYPSTESLLASTVFDIYTDPADRERWKEAVDRDGSHTAELTHRRYDGSVIWVRDTAHVVRDGEGAVLHYEGTLEDITDQRRAEADLRESFELLRATDAQRRMLLDRLTTAQEEERKRISADIHDDSIQIMTAAGMRLGALKRQVTDPEVGQAVSKVEETVRESISRLRHLMFELRPPALDRDGLAAALRMYADNASRTDPAPSYDIDDHYETQPDPEIRAILYRIAQEALTNIRKHAGAGRATILLEERDGGHAVLIRDDGVGFSPEEMGDGIPGHLGLTAMRERADMAGGRVTIHSEPGGGTEVDAWIPHRPGARPEPVR